MKKNYILALFLFFIMLTTTYFISKYSVINAAKIEKLESNNSFKIKEISKEDDKYYIKAYMPVTNIKELDNKINIKYQNIIDKFIKEVYSLNLLENGKKFSLNINFNSYEYDKYNSFLISYICDFGGAHPDTNIITINYNKKDNNFITIDTLQNSNKNIINVFSKYSYEQLSKKKQFKENDEQLKLGTTANKENFESFVFTKDGILILFPNYSIGAYYLGNFEVLISYDKIGF